MTDQEVIRMRDYIDIQIEHLEEAIRLRDLANQKALEIAATELSRRLDILNHAHEQAVSVQMTYLPRREAELTNKDLAQRLSSLEKMIWGFSAVISAVAFIVPIAIQLIFK